MKSFLSLFTFLLFTWFLALLIVGTHHHEGKQMCNAIRLRFFARMCIDITRIDRSRVRVLFAQMVECFVFSKMNARVFLFLWGGFRPLFTAKILQKRGRFCAHLRFAFSLAPSGPRKNCARKKKNGRKRVRFVRWCRFITRVRFARTQTVRWWWFLPVIFFLRERSFRSFFPRDEGALMPFLLLKLTSSSLCLVQINTAQHREPSHWLPKEDWNHGWKQAPRVLRQAHLRRSRSRFVRRRVERLHL